MFQAWNPAENVSDSDPVKTLARHDLLFQGIESFGLIWDSKFPGLASRFKPESIQKALQLRSQLLAFNPHLVMLAEIRYRDASAEYLPENATYWKRNGKGDRVVGWKEGHYFLLDFANPNYQNLVAAQCLAVLKTGVVDGCMFDWWSEETPDRLDLIRKVRVAVGESALIMVNTNGKKPIETAPYINGMYMEGYLSSFFNDWKIAIENLRWAEENLKAPSFTAFEGWGSRSNLSQMRMVTTLALTQSNGYVLFGDPNSLKTPDHLHDWYSFWDQSLGRAAGKMKKWDGAFEKEFENGTVVFNPPGNATIKINFAEMRTSKAFGTRSKRQSLSGGDGDIFLK